ncbi:MAG: hypothetical protein HYU36_24520 [Planctomycetes bacterium]|nr:hypothetical protein [Planctomycetota bacterium]
MNAIQNLIGQVRRLLAGRNMMRHVRALWENNETFSWPGYLRSADYAAATLREAGLENVHVHRFPADGQTLIGDWKMPMAWEGRSATLRLGTEVLADFTRNPLSLFLYSDATPPGGIALQAILPRDLDRGIRNTRQCLLVCGATQGQLPALDALARRRKLAGLALYDPTLPDGILRWHNDFFTPNNPERQIGFSLAREIGRQLEERLLRSRSPTLLHATVDARLFNSHIPLVTAVVPGTHPSREVWYLSQLLEQGAKDSHGGAAVGIETFCALSKAVRHGQLPRLRFSLRILLSMEIFGFHAFAWKHPGIVRRCIAGVAMEGVGIPVTTPGSTLLVGRTFEPLPSFANPLLEEVSRRTMAHFRMPQTRLRFPTPFLCDNCLSDPQIGAPITMFIQSDGKKPLWHTSLDRPEKLEEHSLHFHATLAGAFLYAAASGHPKVTREIAGLSVRDAAERLKKHLTDHRLDYFASQGLATLQSLNSLLPASPLRRKFLELCRRSRPGKAGHPPLTALERRADSWIPSRRVFGPITLRLLPPRLRRAGAGFQTAYSPKWNAPLFWADGRRTVLEIYRNLVIERPGYNLEEIIGFFHFLRKAGFVSESRCKSAETPAKGRPRR